jgi:hypothetical protein
VFVFSPSIIRMIMAKISWAGHVARRERGRKGKRIGYRRGRQEEKDY